jgi:hypothetical protein
MGGCCGTDSLHVERIAAVCAPGATTDGARSEPADNPAVTAR